MTAGCYQACGHDFTRAIAVSKWMVLIVWIGLTACSTSGTRGQDPVNLRVISDQAVFPLAQSLVNGYEASNPAITFTLAQGQRDHALAALAGGEADVALLLLPADDPNLVAIPIGFEAVAITTHPEVGVTNLSKADLSAIYSGQVTNWMAVKGADLPVVVLTYDLQHPARLALEMFAPDVEPITSSAWVVFSEGEMLDTLNQTAGAIGYVPFIYVDERVAFMAIDGVGPTDKGYGLLAPVVLATMGEPNGAVRDLVDWMLSSDGQRIVRQHIRGVRD